MQKLTIEQKRLKSQYQQRFQELKKSMMNYGEFERESHRYGSYYEPDPEEGSMNYRESNREPRRSYMHYKSPDSREGPDYDVPTSKRQKTESGNDTTEDDAGQCKYYIIITIVERDTGKYQ